MYTVSFIKSNLLFASLTDLLPETVEIQRLCVANCSDGHAVNYS